MARPRRFDWLFRPQLADEDMPLSAELKFAEALADLPAIERSALALSEIGGLDTQEIAERLGTDPVVVRKVLARARESVRTSIALRSRRGLAALFPFQNWWQSGSSAPAVRAAGAVAAAVIGTGVAIGGASADDPRDVVTNPDPPAVRALDTWRVRWIPPAAVPAAAAAEPAPPAARRKSAPRPPAKPAAPATSASAPPPIGGDVDLGTRPPAPAPPGLLPPAPDLPESAAPHQDAAVPAPVGVPAPVPPPLPPLELPPLVPPPVELPPVPPPLP